MENLAESRLSELTDDIECIKRLTQQTKEPSFKVFLISTRLELETQRNQLLMKLNAGKR